MCELYKIKIKPETGFITQLQSDTLFGAFCWAYRHIYGQEELNDTLLEDIATEQEQVVFSNAFKSGMLPLPNSYIEDDNETTPLISLEKLQSGKKVKATEINEVEKETVHRRSRDETFIQHTYFSEYEYDVYVYTTIDLELLQPVIELMFETGIGAKKTTGKGHFSVLGITNCSELLKHDNPNSVLMISNYIPAENDPIHGSYRIFKKIAKDINGVVKNPVNMIRAGAVFLVDKEQMKNVYGIVHKDTFTSTTLCNQTIAIPVRITH